MLWGPIWFIGDPSPTNSIQGAVLLLVLVAAFIVGGLNLPKWWALGALALALLAWFALGIIGEGIGC